MATIVERAYWQLPLNGRTIQTLLQIAVPGLEGSEPAQGIRAARFAMDLVQDGVNLQDRNTGAIQSRPPGLDTIPRSSAWRLPYPAPNSTYGECHHDHAQRHQRCARFGLPSDATAASAWRQPGHPPRRRTWFARVRRALGGPVFIPKIYTVRTDLLLRRLGGDAQPPGQHYHLRRVENAMRQGDFSGLIDVNRRITLYDRGRSARATYSKTPYIDNQLPMSRLSPIGNICSA